MGAGGSEGARWREEEEKAAAEKTAEDWEGVAEAGVKAKGARAGEVLVVGLKAGQATGAGGLAGTTVEERGPPGEAEMGVEKGWVEEGGLG